MASSTGPTQTKTRKAGAFDIRVFIGSLIGLYGVVLVLVGLFGMSDSQLAKSDNLNINLWAGLGMVVVALGFFAWARLRPVIVPADVDASSEGRHGH
jgi:membrane-bound ClpP family serine protease